MAGPETSLWNSLRLNASHVKNSRAFCPSQVYRMSGLAGSLEDICLTVCLKRKQAKGFRDLLVSRAGKNAEVHLGPRLTDKSSVQSRDRARPPTPTRRPWEHSLLPTMPKKSIMEPSFKSLKTQVQSPAQTASTVPVWPKANHFLSLYFSSSLSIFPSVKGGNETDLIAAKPLSTSIKNLQWHTASEFLGEFQNFRTGKEKKLLKHFSFTWETRFLHRPLVPIDEKSLASHKSLGFS